MISTPGIGRTSSRLRIDHGRGLLWALTGSVSALWVVFLVDYYFRNASPGLLTVAVLDELAHIATAGIFLLGLSRALNLWLSIGCIAGAVLIDIDHLPEMISSGITAVPAERPFTHSMLPIVVLLIGSLALSGRARWAIYGSAIGVATHVLRDMATGGVPLLSPMSSETIKLTYSAYAGLLIVLVCVPLFRHMLRTFRDHFHPPV